VPCKKFGPSFDNVANLYRGQAEFQKLNGEDPSNESLMNRYAITGFPRFIFTDSTGAKLDEIRGAPSRDDFEYKVKRLLGKS
jgi:thioredoxin-related protein